MSGQAPHGGNSDHKAAWIGAGGAVMAALIAAVAVLLAASNVFHVGAGPAPTAGPTPTVTVTETVPGPAPSGSEPPPTGSTTGAAAAVYHQGPLTLVKDAGSGSMATLDVDPSDHQWGAAEINIQRDLRWDPSSKNLNVNFGVLEDHAPSYADCYAATGYAFTQFTAVQLRNSKGLCLKSKDGRFAALAITALTESKISFDVTVYKKDGD